MKRVLRVLLASGFAGWCSGGAHAGEATFLSQMFSGDHSAVIESVTASGYSGGAKPEFVIDGQLLTTWKSGKEDQALLTLTMAEPTMVESVYLAWAEPAASHGEIEVSLDGETWKQVGRYSGAIKQEPVFVPCERASAKYVRLRCRQPSPKRKGKPGQFLLKEIIVNPEWISFQENLKEPAEKIYSDQNALERANAMMARMSLEQKLTYLGGESVMKTYAFEDVGLPRIEMTDASMGVKHPPNTAFPSTILLAATWNPDLAALHGKSVAEACRNKGINIILGPGVNIYRNASNGRNFEYMGEDPLLVSRMAVPYIQAVQEQGVLATVKHFVSNNIEFRRKRNTSQVGERALREIYFPAFKAAVQEGKVRAVMMAYNLLNHTYCCENAGLIKGVLEGEWGFDGIVMSDWWATYDPVMCFNSGIDIEMPKGRAMNPPVLRDLLENDIISEAELDDKVRTMLYTGYTTGILDRPVGDPAFPIATEAHQKIAEQIAEEGVVLLKNRDGLLPLKAGTIKKLLLVGPMVNELPWSGKGSGEVQFDQGSRPLGISAAFESALGADRVVSYGTEAECNALTDEEIAAADAVIVCVGFNQNGFGKKVYEGEGADRPFALTAPQNRLIERCTALNTKTAVAITAGGGIDMKGWNDKAGAILHTWYTGAAGALPLQKIVLGEINPSGRLPISIERNWEDAPGTPEIASYIKTGDLSDRVHGRALSVTSYDEGVLVGYRWYDTKNLPVMYPFGHGLSYTTFEMSNARISSARINRGDSLVVSVDVTNTGEMAGGEVVQCYVRDEESSVLRPVRELKAFEKIELEPGETRTVTLKLDEGAFAFWDEATHAWRIEPGRFTLELGRSSRDIRQTLSVTVR